VGTYPSVGDNTAKAVLIPHTLCGGKRAIALKSGPAAHQVVGGVMAHQARDGSLVCEDDQPDWD
jgi:hypothetical protein